MPQIFPVLFRRRLTFFEQTRKLKTSQNTVKTSFFRRRLRWYTLPASFIATFVVLDQIRSYRLNRLAKQLQDSDDVGRYYKAHQLEIWLYQVLPLRLVSRVWGCVNQIDLPKFLREPLLGLYSRSFNCNLHEAKEPNLNKYRNLQEFFCRALKPGIREVEGDGVMNLVSPSDGKVLHFGRVINGRMEQVKGVTYRLDEFLGPQTWRKNETNVNAHDEKECQVCNDSDVSLISTSSQGDCEQYQKSILHNNNGESDLYHCIIYLAPGDYHRFHSPSNWKVNFRRHFSGRLYSVRPSFATWFPNLFSVNERVAYVGQWKHGFFSMIPVGATNVGSMRIYSDSELTTNESMKFKFNYCDKTFQPNEVIFQPGDPFGQFNLGSTIVLIFEAPKSFHFTVKRGMSLKYGQEIGLI